MPKKVKTSEGDVFVMQLGEDLYAYGQIVLKWGVTHRSYSNCVIVAFDYFTQTVSTDPMLIVRTPIIFQFSTMDWELVDGRWKIIGSVPPSPDIVFPEYKIGTDDDVYVVSVKGEILRDATLDEIERLDYQPSYTGGLEKALEAKRGLIPWEDWLDEIVYAHNEGKPPISNRTSITEVGLFWNVSGNKKENTEETPEEEIPEHAVIVHFRYFLTKGEVDLQPLYKLEDRLENAISSAGVGDYDGNEVAEDGSDGFLYMYGPDGNKLFETVKPILKSTKFTKDASVTIRFGPSEDDVKEITIKLDSNS